MPNNQDDKRIIGLLGEMHLAIQLHTKGWQVYRAYIDEQIDFILAKYYCNNCKEFSGLKMRKKPAPSTGEFPTNLCKKCGKEGLEFITRFIQAKASAGIEINSAIRAYSFHAKLRSNVDDRSFYVWMAFRDMILPPFFYIFSHKSINRFDNLALDSYQKTDNQKTTLRIDREGRVLNEGRKHNYDCFNDMFRDNFGILDELVSDTLK